MVTYLALFKLKEADPVKEQLQIFLGSFPGQLGSNKLAMEGGVVVVLAGIQVDFLVLVVSVVLVLLLGKRAVLGDLVVI